MYDWIFLSNRKFSLWICKNYEIQEVLFGEPVLDRYNTSIQNITLKLKEYKGKNNEFVVLDIFKNKESLLKKIAKIIKERWVKYAFKRTRIKWN